MAENMNMEKSECVEDGTRELTLRINSMEENMELLKQRTTTCKRGNKKLQDRVPSLEEGMGELHLTVEQVKQDTDKLLKMVKTVHGIIDGGLKRHVLVEK